VEVARIADVSSRLIVNRTALKTRSDELTAWIDRFAEVTRARAA
jgi:ATP phosphoribosyltransferase